MKPILSERIGSAACFLALSSFFILGCVNLSNRRAPENGSGSDLTVTVEFDKKKFDELKDQNLEHFLSCDGAYKEQKSKSINGKGDKFELSFPDANMTPGQKCVYEVRGLFKPAADFEFVSISEPKREGLFFSSNEAESELVKIDGQWIHALVFEKFVQTFSRKYIDSFTASMEVKFELQPGDVLGSNLLANLHCGDAAIYGGSLQANATTKNNHRKFNFSLSATLLKNTRCSKIVIAEKNVALFESKLANVRFSLPNKGGVLPILEIPTVRSSGPLYGIARCSEFTSDGKCLQVKLPSTQTNWFAVVHVNSTEIVVTYDGGVLQNHNDSEIAASRLNSSSGFSFYKKKEFFDIFRNYGAGEFYRAVLNGEISDEHVKTSEPVGSVEYFTEFYTYGMRTVRKGFLDTFDPRSATWMGVATISLNGKEEQIVVAGPEKYFTSSSKIAGAVFFDKNLFPSNFNDYAAYAGKGSKLASGCNRSIRSIIEIEGTFDTEEMRVDNQDLDACKIIPTKIATASLVSIDYLLQHWDRVF